MMRSVNLKGKGNQYYLEINSNSDFAQSLNEINELLQKLKKNAPLQSEPIPIIIDSQNRLLTTQQWGQIKNIISQFPLFTLQQTVSNVWSRKQVKQLVEKNFLNIETKVIRSGKIAEYQGNLLLLGDVHKNAIVRATGDIYIGCNVEGIIHAGFPDFNDAIITGNINHASQIRISDLIQIVADLEVEQLTDSSLFYINDLHVITHDQIINLNKIKPRRKITLD